MPAKPPKPIEVLSTVLHHPKLVTRLPPHFIVHRQPLSKMLISEDEVVKKLLKQALAHLQGRMFCAVDYYENELLFGFEEPADLTYFTLMHNEDDF